ncbi:MAG: pilus assembly protein [Sphingopyxis sp.]|nr:pilus assembly protein [Sphingopyxis sp.]
MALILPMLLAIMFGGFEAGAYLWAEHKVIKGVRDGARFAGRQPFASYSCSALTNTATLAQVKNLTRTGQLTGGTAKVSGWTDAQVNVSVSCNSAVNQGLYSNQAGGAIRVTVSTTVPYPSLFQTLGFDTTGAVIHSSANAAVMGT